MAGATSGDLPAVEFDYGILPNGRVAIVAPLAFDRSTGAPFQSAYGDTDIEFKYRFIEQDKHSWSPSVAAVPTIELPSGNVHRGLGNGNTRFFLPIGLQKDFGDWTTYGGGGYWINQGRPGNRNFWYAGWVLQRKVTDKLAIGAELFHQTASEVDASDGEVMAALASAFHRKALVAVDIKLDAPSAKPALTEYTMFSYSHQ